MFCSMSHYLRKEWALTIVRITLGVIFIAHGSQKVLGLFGGPGLEGWAQWGLTLGIPKFLSYIAAFCELIGGILLFFGIAAEIGALLVIPVMIGAIALVHWPHGFFIQNNGFEYALTLIMLAITVLVGGPGKFAVYDVAKKMKHMKA